MENEFGSIEVVKKVPIYKQKKFAIPIAAILGISLVFAAVLIYHTSAVNINVNEGRYSTDGTFTINCYTGETYIQNANVYNYANVPLNTNIVFTEESNSNAVEYTVDVGAMPVSLPSGVWTTIPVTISCSAVSPAGAVVGRLDYQNAP